jgi:hypothetical protein
MIRKIAISMLVAGMFACVGMAQSKPDFSGTWNLNVNKSDFGPVPGPNSETVVITQDGPKVTENVKYEDDQGKQVYDLAYTTDGTEIVYPADSAPKLGIVTLQKLKANWQGTSLVLTESLKYQEDADVTGTISRGLSADGKVLTMNFDLMTPMGAMARKFVFDRADSAAAMPAMSAAGSTPAPATAMTASPSAASPAATAPMASASSGATPNLSGNWKLNVAKSDFGSLPGPDSRVEKIDDNEPSIKISSTWTGGPMGDGSMILNLMTNGKETTSSMFGTDAKNVAKWDGSALVVNTTFKMQDSDVAVKSKYELAADGKTMNIASHISGPMGEMDMKMVYEKQP